MITEYYRPTTVEEALTLATRPGSVIVAGGTTVVADPGGAVGIVDLQALDLRDIEPDGGDLRIGSMTTLQGIADHPDVPVILRSLAERELPSVLRNAATVGGTVATAEWDSELLTALLALDAKLEILTPDGAQRVDVATFWGLTAPTIITSICVSTGGKSASDRTGRTPLDRPIVCAIAHRDDATGIRLALGGVATRPLVVEPDDVAELEPPGDFRGSPEYRRHLATVLSARVLAAIEGGR